jgi:hypothetical protein
MMLTLKFPRSDTALLNWSVNLLDRITADPTAYNLVAADATAYQAVHDAFQSALEACEPSRRTKPAVVAKDSAILSLKDQANLVANKVYSSASVTVAQKVELGFPPRATPQNQPAATIAPVIEFLGCNGLTAIIRLSAGAGLGRGKLAGMAGASIFSFVGAEPPTDSGQWKFEGSVARVTRIEIPFPATTPAGAQVFLTSFWFNARMQSGPLTPPFGFNLPGGGVSMAE